VQRFHHFKAVHLRHLQVKQDQVVAVFSMQPGHHLGISCGGQVRVTGIDQHPFEQQDIGFLVIDDENTGV
jgi:hypothetical protein